jgi:hypothetical protein
MFKSFSAASVKAILVLSHDTTFDEVDSFGGSVNCPPATKRAFLVKSI